MTMARSQSGQRGNIQSDGTSGHRYGVTIRNYFVKQQGISFDDNNWQSYQLGRLNFDGLLWGKRTVGYDADALADPALTLDAVGDAVDPTDSSQKAGTTQSGTAQSRIAPSRDTTLTGTVSAVRSVVVEVNGQSVPATIDHGKFSAKIHLPQEKNTVRVIAYGRMKKSIEQSMTLYAYGEKLGSMADAQGDDNGPGEYTYRTDSAFKPGTFDMT